MPLQLKLGKTDARPGAVKLRLKDYLPKAALPAVPASFGHEALVPSWGMLANDRLGDCVIAGACHETMLWNAEARASVAFDDAAAVKNYSAIAGYRPSDPATDQGTDMEVAAKYRRKTGIVDSKGKRHKSAAYLDLTPGDVHEHLLAAYLFGAVGVGIRFPAFAMDDFDAGKLWDVQKANAKLEGGHYVPGVSCRDGNLVVVTWGKPIEMTPAFLKKYNDESVCYLSEEMLANGVSLDGFKLADLQADLAGITKQ